MTPVRTVYEEHDIYHTSVVARNFVDLYRLINFPSEQETLKPFCSKDNNTCIGFLRFHHKVLDFNSEESF